MQHQTVNVGTVKPSAAMVAIAALCALASAIGVVCIVGAAAWIDRAERRADEAEAQADQRVNALAQSLKLDLIAMKQDVQDAKADGRAAISKYELVRAWQARIDLAITKLEKAGDGR